MQQGASWRFESDQPQSLETALLVRDAAGLIIPATLTELPPPIDRPVDRVSCTDPELAGAQWLAWWPTLVEYEFTRAPGRPMSRKQVFDPPEFHTLPQPLRAAATAALRPRTRSAAAFDWATMKAMAEQVAHELDVEISVVHGKAVLVPVEGRWWYRHRPGGVICSEHAALDPPTARLIMLEAFRSSVLG